MSRVFYPDYVEGFIAQVSLDGSEVPKVRRFSKLNFRLDDQQFFEAQAILLFHGSYVHISPGVLGADQIVTLLISTWFDMRSPLEDMACHPIRTVLWHPLTRFIPRQLRRKGDLRPAEQELLVVALATWNQSHGRDCRGSRSRLFDAPESA